MLRRPIETTALIRHLSSGYSILHNRVMQIADLSDDDPLKFYLRELAKVQPLTGDENTGLLKQIRSGNDSAEHAAKRLIETNLSLVVAIAERFRSYGCPSWI